MVLKELIYDYLAETYYRLRMLSGYCRREAWNTSAWDRTNEQMYRIWFLWYDHDPGEQRFQRYPEQWNRRIGDTKLKWY